MKRGELVNKRYLFVLSVIIFFTVFSVAVLSQQAVMNLEGGSLGDVSFPHQKHQKVISKCDACHGLFPKEKGIIQKNIAEKKLKKKKVMGQCVDCHKERATDNKMVGPVKCKGCHKK